jgi:F-type H+/Na+-transporting ATPase subunit alpha
VATKGLLDRVPVEKVRAFEKEYLERLTLRHDDVLRSIVQTGKLSDEATATFEKVADELSALYAD